MSRKRTPPVDARLDALRSCLEDFEGRYAALKPGAKSVGDYLSRAPAGADEETLTEPVLAQILERVLGFGAGTYFPQLGRSGLKPDFTPIDLIAHPFVLDAKSSGERFSPAHVSQIQRYVKQRSLQWGILFNLHELRVYARGSTAYDRELSFPLLPLWQIARGEALPGPELHAFEAFCEAFAFRELDVPAKIEHVGHQPSWAKRLAAGEDVQVDVEYLVEQLRLLAAQLGADAGAATEELDRYLAAAAGRDERLLHELEQIALDLEPGTDLRSLPTSVAAWRGEGGLAGRVWRQYLLRVAYLALTRILLYRAWEDVQFVDETLYDGGFDRVYTQLRDSVRDVLRRALALGAERYRTLFLAENNYEWFVPSERVLVEVLYRLGSVPLGRLDQDALGALYVSYVDEIDRDRLGQFFTPRDVVRFMLDRAGFVGPDGLFHVAGDERTPVRILDFATGSGGFLVEAARRIVDESGIAHDDAKGLGEALAGIARGFFGGEISPFPYYLTEINLLLQVSRLLGRLRLLGVEPPPVAARVVAHLQRALGSDPRVERLADSWNVVRGVETGADAYTARIDRRLTPEQRRALAAAGVAIGDPILELPARLAATPPWSRHPEVLARSPESRGLLYGVIDEEDVAHLVVLRGGTEPPAAVLEALERFKPILATRAEIARNPRRAWWETAWPRDARDLRAPKAIALYRTDRAASRSTRPASGSRATRRRS